MGNDSIDFGTEGLDCDCTVVSPWICCSVIVPYMAAISISRRYCFAGPGRKASICLIPDLSRT